MFELLSSNVLKLNTVFGAKTLISKRSSVQYKITVGYKITEFTLTRIFHPDWNKIKVPWYARFLYTSNNLYYNVKWLLQYLLKWRVPLRVSK